MKAPFLKRGARRVSQSVLVLACLIGAAIFVFWSADLWVVRDKFEHLRAVFFGPYVEPACRSDTNAVCRNGKVVKPTPKRKHDICTDNPGLELHCRFQALYKDLNRELFENRLPPAVITLQRSKDGVAGYFAYRRFLGPDGQTIDEIALNPRTFRRVSMRRLISTLVHEMVHLENAHFGKPGPGGFHNEEWGKRMRRVGLAPSHNGRPGGRTTGKRMTHYIVPGGLYDRFARRHPLIGNRKVVLVEGGPHLGI